MSAKDNPCRKFQANIFNKSKCQNCFKPRESHLLSDEDLNQAKPIYGGWLLLAPEGTDFDNPMHRSRKWQRRFFILYEHGLLRYALDEMPTTLPQGTINMNQCTDVIDGESRTGQKFSLCILTPEEHFIRAENKEIINGWLEMLAVYPRTNKQNQKKKRKVEPPTPQEPGPAKMAVTSSGIPSAEKVPATKSTLWQEEIRGKEAQESSGLIPSPLQTPSSPSEPMPDSRDDGGLVNGDHTDGGRKTRVESGYFSLEKTKDMKAEEQALQAPPSPSAPDAPSRYSIPNALSPGPDPFSPPGNWLCQQPDGGEWSVHCPPHRANRQYAILADVPRARRISHRDAFQVEKRRLEQRTRARSPGKEEVARLFGQQRRRSQVIEKFEALDIEKAENMETACSPTRTSEARQGRSEKRAFPRKRDFIPEPGVGSIPDVSASSLSPYRRAKSLDRRSTESSMTPDLLNFKKGWLTKQYEDGQWKKHWFVLTDQSLRYYRDSVAEEAADLDGEIDLSTCYDVTEYPVQRNYGFQIHTKEGEFTLSAMTSGIRRNWIQTIIKHVRPSTAPDVTSSLPEEKSKTLSSYDPVSKQSDKQDSEHSDADTEQKRSRARERRREGRSKTFDWAEFRPIQQALAQERAQAAEALKSTSSYDTTDSKSDLGELERERARRREERRKRFESSESVEESAVDDASHMEVDRGPVSPDATDGRHGEVQVEIEHRWQQVETTPLREEKQIPIAPVQLPTAPHTLHSEDITILLEKQLEQSQREVSGLLEQKLVLQQRLKESLALQHSARDGYVLQTELADSSSDAWQRLHKVNEDLQSELEAQCRRQELLNHQIQSLKHSYGEAKDSVGHQDTEAQNLQARLSSAAMELAMKEQMLARLKGDLKMENEKAREMLEEWQSREEALNSQLRASEQKLKEAEALLLEKKQELRDLEMKQTLQRDYQKEMQRLQDKLTDLGAQLGTSEQARVLTEERLQRSYEDLLGSCEKEKQLLLHNLKEEEDRLVEYEDRLQDNEQLMEVLQKEKLNANTEIGIIVHQLEEQLAGRESRIQKLGEYIEELEGERDAIKLTCQEMANQIAVSDTENASLQARLKMREGECYNLGSSLDKVSEELLRVQESLKDKEVEFRCVLDTHGKLVEKKDLDINEALIKMAALGNSLEETETKLKVKEEALRRVCSFNSGPQAKEMDNLYAQLESAENRIIELEQSLQVQSGNPVREDLGRDRDLENSQRQLGQYSFNMEGLSTCMATAERGQDTGAKRQRIRFSNIQCQKYVHGDGSEKTWTSSTSSDTSQDRSLSEESASSDTAPQYPSSGASDADGYLSVIHSLETKLYVTEEKLKDVTRKLEDEKSRNQEMLLGLHGQWARTESSLREQLQSSIGQVSALTQQLEEEQREKLELMTCHPTRVQKEALSCLEACRKMVKDLLNRDDTAGLHLSTLSSMEAALSNAMHCFQPTLKCDGFPAAIQCEGGNISALQPCEDPLQLLSEKIALEARLINNVAESLKRGIPETSQAVQEIRPNAETFSMQSMDNSVSLVEILAKKLMLEREFWSRVEGLGTAIVRNTGDPAGECEMNPACSPQSLVYILSDNTLIKAELVSVAQKMESYHEQIKTLEVELQTTKAALEQRCLLEGVTSSYGSPNYEHVMHQIPKELDPPYSLSQSCKHPVRHKESPSSGAASIQEVLCHHLKKKAEVLNEISSALISMSPDVSQGNVQRLLEASQQLSACDKMLNPCNFPSRLVQDAVVQAQLFYVTCKTRLECERDAGMSRVAVCQDHAETLAKVYQEYQEMLQQKQNELSDMLAVLERERETAEAVARQAEGAERNLREAAEQHRERMSQLEDSYEEDIQNLIEKWAESENFLKAAGVEVVNKLQALEQEMQNAEKSHMDEMSNLEAKFQTKVHELRVLHREEIQTMEDRYTHSIQQLQDTLDSYQQEHALTPSSGIEQTSKSWSVGESRGAGSSVPSETDSLNVLRGRIRELEAQIDVMREELEHKHLEGNLSALRAKYQTDFENLKATCERGFAAMEDTHQKKIEDLQRQHHRELEKLRDEKERLLAEETAATISAIEAMKNAHREEMGRELEKTHRSQISSVNADVESLRRQYLEELESVQRELEVLSEQYSQKCLENAHLAQALEAERQALRQCQRENQELNAHNQELNNRLATEITRLRMLLTGEGGGSLSPLSQGKDAYELEVLLRVKESEIQYQKQEISSLKDELHTALRDKKYASDKYKDMYTELSIVKAKADCDISRLKEQLSTATEMLGDKSPGSTAVSGYDIMKSKSNPDFLKKDRPGVGRQLRNLRSKSLKEGLTVQERLKLFESRDMKKH
ncbi:myosin phosphatase Rho-interacting protein isoform X2 [Ascaphus truei]|uniref:myosin phosphatase Rho-interacting protein isoform X2 n=1 Tax=Ascaphus truei TaxID=8439 RepID=UPI003F596359